VQIIEKLSVKAPVADTKLKVLKIIAHEYSTEWDLCNTEATTTTTKHFYSQAS
jgi:hypothetical protein